MQQLPVLKSLEHANMWDMSTFGTLFTQTRNYWAELAQACTPPITELLCLLFVGTEPVSAPSCVTQWLVSNSNFHLTLARLSLTAPTVLSNFLLSSLHTILNSKAPDASKWTQDLLDAGFGHSLQTRVGAEEFEEHINMLAHLKLHHLQRASSTNSALAETMALTAADAPEEHETILNNLPGVYHVTGYRIRDWEHTTVTPFFASFQVDRRSLSLSVGTDGLNDEIDEEGPQLPEDLSEDSAVVKMTGHGRYVDRHGEISLVELKIVFVRDGNDLKMHATIGGKARMSLSGSPAYPMFAGGIAYWDDDPTSEEFPPAAFGGAFLLWKSALPDTESNWNNVHIRDIDALRKLRTSGGFEFERSQARKLPKPDPANPQPSLQEALNYVMKLKFHRQSIATLIYHPTDFPAMKTICANFYGENEPVPVDCSKALPRGPYDTDEIHDIRGRLHYALLYQTPQSYLDAAYLMIPVYDVTGDLIVLCKAMKRLFSSLKEDAELKQSELPQDLIAALDSMGLRRTSDELQILITDLALATQRLQRHLKQSKTSELPAKLISSLEWIAVAMQMFFNTQGIERLEKPVEAALASERILKYLLEEDKPKPTTNSSGESDAVANESSPLCKAIVAEYERLDSQNDLTKVIRKWSYVFGTARPGIDVYSENMIPSLMISLSKAILPSSDSDDESLDASAETDDDESLFESDAGSDSLFATKFRSYGVTTTTLIAIGTASALFGLGAFALGRWIAKR